MRVCRDIDCTIRAKEEYVCRTPALRPLAAHVCLRVCALSLALLWAVTRHVPASIGAAAEIRGQEIGILKSGLYDYWRSV